MSGEDTNTQVENPADETTGTEGTGTGSKLSYEDMATELAKVRREAAERRVANREKEEELAEYRKWKESQMTELEKAQARAADLEKERRADLVELAITKFDLDAEDADLISGKTKEEILASAERISKRLGRKPAGEQENRNPNLFPGTRGKPVGSGTVDHNDELRNRLWGRS